MPASKGIAVGQAYSQVGPQATNFRIVGIVGDLVRAFSNWFGGSSIAPCAPERSHSNKVVAVRWGERARGRSVES